VPTGADRRGNKINHDCFIEDPRVVESLAMSSRGETKILYPLA
jgi:hypothetical protein